MPPVKQASPKKAARTIDLDGSRAARLEAADEPVVVSFGGKKYTLPVELPAEFAILAQQGNLVGSVQALLGDAADKFFDWKPSIDDLTQLVKSVNELYGVTPGESPASPST